MGQAIKRHLTDSMNLFITEIKPIGIIKDFERKKQAKKDHVILNHLHYEIKLMLNQLETTYDIRKDLNRFVKFIFWLENFNVQYRLKLTDEDKIKRTFYVDSINRFFYHCMAHLHLFDLKLRIDLSSKKPSRERAVYISLFLEEEIAKQELCEYFSSFGKYNHLEVSSIGNLIEEISETKYWPNLKLGIGSRICNNFRKEEILNIKNELSIRINPQLTPLPVINNFYNSYDYYFKQNDNRIEEKKGVVKTKIKSDTNIALIKWQPLLCWFEDFFDLPFLKNNNIQKTEIKRILEILQKKSYDGKIPPSLTSFFKNDMNRRVFLFFLKHISEKQNSTCPIPELSSSSFAKRWSSNLKIEKMKYHTVNNFLGNKNCRDELFTLNSYKEFFPEIKDSIKNLKSDLLLGKKTFHNNLQPFLDYIFSLCK